MAGLGDLFGKGSIAEQIFVWGVLNQVIGALASPYFDVLTQDVNNKHPEAVRAPSALVPLVVQGFLDRDAATAEARRSGLDEAKFHQLLDAGAVYLSPADLAQLVVRNFVSREAAAAEAAHSGVSAHQLDLLTRIAADAPGPEQLVEGLRRGLIPPDAASEDTPSFAGGIREGRLADKWIPLFRGLGEQWPSPVDALQAELEGQLPHDEALAQYKLLGGAERFYPWLFNTRGNAPTPVEALELLNRGIIAERGRGPGSTSYEQAFLEGPWRNKWLEPFLALRTYVTPPRSVVAMVHNGALSDQQAATELAKAGMEPDMIAAYIAEGHQRASAAEKALTQAAILDLYAARVIKPGDAHELLVALGYSPGNATYLITLRDLQRSIAAVNTAITRVHTLYTGHKITKADAVGVLNALSVPADQVSDIIGVWDLEAAVNVIPLTESQVALAFFYGILTQAEAQGELESLGYTPLDAWTLLSIRHKSPLPGKPAPGPRKVGTT